MVRIFNNKLDVEIENMGAQISKITSKSGREFLWQRNDPFWWRYCAPILFPIVGKVKDGEYFVDGEKYELSGHGFARTTEFDLFEQSENSATFVYKSEGRNLEQYPFDFELYIKYTIIDEAIDFEWTVKNVDSKEMYFSIGGHPAFNVDRNKEIKLDILPKEDKTVKRYFIKGPYLDRSEECSEYEYTLTKDSFSSDALIFENLKGLRLYQDDFEISLDMKNMPLVGIWAQTKENQMSPFVCIEPWAGIADPWTHDGNFKKKLFINSLESGKCKVFNFTLNFKNR